MRDKFMGDFAIDSQGIQVSFVPFDEFLDSNLRAIGDPGLDDDLFQFCRIANLPGCGSTGAVWRLDDQWESNLLCKFARYPGVVGPD